MVHLPSHGEPPSSMAAIFQGLSVVSGVGLAMRATAIRLASGYWGSRRLAGSTFEPLARPESKPRRPAQTPCRLHIFTSACRLKTTSFRRVKLQVKGKGQDGCLLRQDACSLEPGTLASYIYTLLYDIVTIGLAERSCTLQNSSPELLARTPRQNELDTIHHPRLLTAESGLYADHSHPQAHPTSPR